MKPKALSSTEYLNFIKKLGIEKRKLMGEERDKIWQILQMLEPMQLYNNQRAFTETYEYQGKKYYVHHGLEETPVIEEE